MAVDARAELLKIDEDPVVGVWLFDIFCRGRGRAESSAV